MGDRAPRTTHGPNFKWDVDTNTLAYYCFRCNASKEIKDFISNHYKEMNPSSLEVRIQHFNSLTDDSKNTTTNPSKQTIEIYESLQHISDEECSEALSDRLKEMEFAPIKKEVIQSNDELGNIDEYFKSHWSMQRKFQHLEMNDFELSRFLKIASTMNIKSCGIKIEKRFIALNKLRKSVMSEEGDAWLANGEGVEVKTSFITPLLGSSVSLTGLRLWEQKVNHYFLFVVDLRDLDFGPKPYAMWIPKEYLQFLDDQGKLRTPGLKKSDAKDNKKVQKSLSIKIDKLEDWVKRFPLPSHLKI